MQGQTEASVGQDRDRQERYRPIPLMRACLNRAVGVATNRALSRALLTTEQALANLLPLLMCGEASAERLFEDLATRLEHRLDVLSCAALRSIGQDEVRHGLLLADISARLPPPGNVQAGRHALRFLRGLHCSDSAIRLTRVAALDAAVCLVLSTLVRRGNALDAHPSVQRVLQSIRGDEGRHVRIARHAARRLGLSPARENEEREQVWCGFVALLDRARGELQLLGVDIDRLFSARGTTRPILTLAP